MNAHDYGPTIAELLHPPRLMPLGPGQPNESLRATLQSLTINAACRAGLWLLHDFLDESHTISQDLSSREGSYWHAIMHRREPDAWNSKYWFRKVGTHPVLASLAKEAAAIGYRYKSAEDFIDFIERVRGTNTPDEELARRVQMLEWELLFDWCWELG